MGPRSKTHRLPSPWVGRGPWPLTRVRGSELLVVDRSFDRRLPPAALLGARARGAILTAQVQAGERPGKVGGKSGTGYDFWESAYKVGDRLRLLGKRVALPRPFVRRLRGHTCQLSSRGRPRDRHHARRTTKNETDQMSRNQPVINGLRGPFLGGRKRELISPLTRARGSELLVVNCSFDRRLPPAALLGARARGRILTAQVQAGERPVSSKGRGAKPMSRHGRTVSTLGLGWPRDRNRTHGR